MALITALIERLSAPLREALPFVESLAKAGKSANEIGRILTGEEIPFTRSQLLEVVRGIKDIVDVRNYVDSLRKDVLPNPERLAPAITNILRHYSYTVEVTGFFGPTGDTMSRFITISTDDLLSKEAAEELGIDLIANDTERYSLDPESARVTDLVRAPF